MVLGELHKYGSKEQKKSYNNHEINIARWNRNVARDRKSYNDDEDIIARWNRNCDTTTMKTTLQDGIETATTC